jgi:hypothetical protein
MFLRQLFSSSPVAMTWKNMKWRLSIILEGEARPMKCLMLVVTLQENRIAPRTAMKKD